MAKQKTILYVEDSLAMLLAAGMQLERAFPGYHIVLSVGRQDTFSKIESGKIKLEEIALVCTDGRLAEGSKGWEVAEDLVSRGFTGPLLYTSETKIPNGKEVLYLEVGVDKCGDGLIEAIKRHI
ncbi:MAG: hypothetical protein AABX26_01785 [Nanoarchaeota archaeon]